MIADLKPYAEYKGSGLPWLGEVPGHWEPKKLKHAFKRIVGGSTPASGNPRYWNGDVTWVTPADVSRSKRLRRSIRQITRAGLLSCSTELVPKGSIVLTSRAPVGNVAIADVDLCTNQGCKALIPDTAVMAPMFGFWLLSVMKAELQSLSMGTTFSEISTSRLGSTFGILPPPAEQAAIVRFLDWVNGRLERSIRAKRKVIALLNEQKQVIIHRAITRGLDPSVPLKPAGIPWLGDIPQHWEVTRSKRLFTSRSDLALPDDVQLSATQAYGVIPQSEFEEKVGRRVVKILMHLEKRRHVEKDDFVISMRSFQGGLERAWASGAIRSSYVVLKAEHGCNTDFFAYLFKSRGYIGAIQATGGFIRDGQDLNFSNFCRVDLPLVPPDEQTAIAAFIADSTVNMDATTSRLEREIELLREYRTRLIADVVTGKLDVREAATRLPDEAVPQTADDESDLSIDPETAGEEAAV